MNLYLINRKIKVLADGIAGAIYLADEKHKCGIEVEIKLLVANYEKDFNPRVLN